MYKKTSKVTAVTTALASALVKVFILRHTIVAGYYGILVVCVSAHLSVCLSHLSVFSFSDNNELISIDFHQTWYVH